MLLKFTYLFLVCVCCTHVCRCVCTCRSEGQRLSSRTFCITLHRILLRHDLSLNLELIDLVRLVSSCYCLSSCGIIGTSRFLCRCWGSKFRFSSLPIETSPLAHNFPFQLCLLLPIFVFSPCNRDAIIEQLR